MKKSKKTVTSSGRFSWDKKKPKTEDMLNFAIISARDYADRIIQSGEYTHVDIALCLAMISTLGIAIKEKS